MPHGRVERSHMPSDGYYVPCEMYRLTLLDDVYGALSS